MPGVRLAHGGSRERRGLGLRAAHLREHTAPPLPAEGQGLLPGRSSHWQGQGLLLGCSSHWQGQGLLLGCSSHWQGQGLLLGRSSHWQSGARGPPGGHLRVHTPRFKSTWVTDIGMWTYRTYLQICTLASTYRQANIHTGFYPSGKLPGSRIGGSQDPPGRAGAWLCPGPAL